MNEIWKRIGVVVMSGFLFLAVLELVLRLGGYVYLEKLLRSAGIAERDGRAHVVLTIGDSYTVGGDAKWESNYPSQLQNLLSDKFPGRFEVINGGICESNTSQVFEYLQKLNEVYEIDTVILLAGAANRFNPSGFNRSRFNKFLLRMRLTKLVQIFSINLRGRLFQQQAKKHFRSPSRSYAFDKTMDWENSIVFCDEAQLQALEGAVSSKPNDFESYMQLAACYNDRGDFERAEEMYKRIISVTGGFSEAYKSLGRFYYKQGRFEEVEALYKGLIESRPLEAWPYVKLAQYYMDRHQEGQVEELLKKALALNDDQFHVFTALARHYEINDRFEECARMNAGALKIVPDIDVYADLAWAYIRLGEYERALKVFLESIELYPGEFMNYYSLLRSYQFQSTYDADYILNVLDRVKSKNPDLEKNADFRNYVLFLRSQKKLEKDIEEWVNSDIEKIVDFCEANGLRLIVQNYPYSFLSANRMLKEAAERHALPFVDNFSVFSKFPPEDEEKYFTDFEHCTRAGYEVMAKNILEVFDDEQNRE